MAAIESISLRCCRSMSLGNNCCASGASSKNRPYRVERLPDEINLFRRHDADRRLRKLLYVCSERTSRTSGLVADPRQDRDNEPDHAGILGLPRKSMRKDL